MVELSSEQAVSSMQWLDSFARMLFVANHASGRTTQHLWLLAGVAGCLLFGWLGLLHLQAPLIDATQGIQPQYGVVHAQRLQPYLYLKKLCFAERKCMTCLYARMT